MAGNGKGGGDVKTRIVSENKNKAVKKSESRQERRVTKEKNQEGLKRVNRVQARPP